MFDSLAVDPLDNLEQFHIWCIGDGWSMPSGVHNCRQFLDRALAPEVMFPSPQWLKPSHCRILTAPLKRCSTLYTKCENALGAATWRFTQLQRHTTQGQ